MRYQVAQAQQNGEDGAQEAFEQAMVDDTTAAIEVGKFAELNPPDQKYARKQFIDWAEFRRRHGTRALNKNQPRWMCPNDKG